MAKFSTNIPQENRARLFSAVQQNWAILESQGPDTPAHKKAYQQLYNITEKFNSLTKQRQMQQQQAGQNVGQAQQMQNAGVRPGQGAQSGQQQMEQKPVIKTEGRNQGLSISPQQLQSIETFQYTHPPHAPAGTPQGDAWLQETKNSLKNLMQLGFNKSAQDKQFTAQAAKEQQAGNIQQAEMLQREALKARVEWENAQKKVQAFKMNQARMKQEMEKAAQSTDVKVEDTKPVIGMANQAQARVGNASVPQTAATPIQKQQQPPSSTMAQQPPSNPAMHSQAQTTRPQAAHSPVSATLPQHQQGQSTTSFPRPQQGAQQPARPALNTQQPLGPGIPSAGPTSATSSQPVALSHTAAIDAARSYSEQQRATGSQPTSQPQPPHNVHSARPSEHSTSTAQRYPIPKTLHQAALDRPGPVTGAPQRPSLAVQGVMSQPVLQKNSGFVLEGEGSSRVLSKKKLDELVRQVTGGTDSLTPEVEEVFTHSSSKVIVRMIMLINLDCHGDC
jgi:transcription initiation factor TFIID subunit 12